MVQSKVTLFFAVSLGKDKKSVILSAKNLNHARQDLVPGVAIHPILTKTAQKAVVVSFAPLKEQLLNSSRIKYSILAGLNKNRRDGKNSRRELKRNLKQMIKIYDMDDGVFRKKLYASIFCRLRSYM